MASSAPVHCTAGLTEEAVVIETIDATRPSRAGGVATIEPPETGALAPIATVIPPRSRFAAARGIVVGVFVASGAAGLMYQVVWSSQLVLVFGNT
ncbi:MAG: hypothetical protein ABR498_07900, partial [Candidatus Dormibacteria bacterium]